MGPREVAEVDRGKHERTSRVEDRPEVVTRVGVSSRG